MSHAEAETLETQSVSRSSAGGWFGQEGRSGQGCHRLAGSGGKKAADLFPVPPKRRRQRRAFIFGRQPCPVRCVSVR